MKKKYIKFIIGLIITLLFMFPIYWMIITSLKTEPEMNAYPPTFFPENITFRGYADQLSARSRLPIISYFINSLILAGLTLLISTALSTLSAYGLARFNLKINKYILLVFLITQMLPIVLFYAPLFILFRNIGLFDSLLAPVISTCLHAIPFSILTLTPYFLTIPKELESAALIDGCDKLTTFLYVMVPIVYPGILVIAAFSFIFGWGDLMGPLTFIRTESKLPLTVNMYKAIGEYGTDWNSLMAFAVVVTMPVMIIFIALQKHLVSGLATGSVKG